MNSRIADQDKNTNGLLTWLVAWRSSNALCTINEVALHQAGLVFGWVTACRQVNPLSV